MNTAPNNAATAGSVTSPVSDAEIPASYSKMTTGAIPGEQLVAFAPSKAGNIVRSQLIDQAFAVAAAYQIGANEYANLDIQNTFHRGSGSTLLVDNRLASRTLCPNKELVSGFTACVRVERDRSTLFGYLPDRLTRCAAYCTLAHQQSSSTSSRNSALGPRAKNRRRKSDRGRIIRQK